MTALSRVASRISVMRGRLHFFVYAAVAGLSPGSGWAGHAAAARLGWRPGTCDQTVAAVRAVVPGRLHE